jgi:hypothetical protein
MPPTKLKKSNRVAAFSDSSTSPLESTPLTARRLDRPVPAGLLPLA